MGGSTGERIAHPAMRKRAGANAGLGLDHGRRGDGEGEQKKRTDVSQWHARKRGRQ